MPTEGCWVQIWEDTNYGDNTLIIHGPAEYGNMRGLPDAHGYDWGDQAGSLRTGPQTWVIAFADENFQDTSITVGPDTEIPDLGDMEDEIDSIRILDHTP
jgi:hypothetical protein